MSTPNCSNFEELIALYVESELSASDYKRVEEHLRKCASCWDLAEDLKESQTVFKTMREEAPDDAAVFALRERVLADVNGLRPMTWFERLFFGQPGKKAAFASVALMITAGGALWLMRVPPAPGPTPPPHEIARDPDVTPPPQRVAESANSAAREPIAPRIPEPQPEPKITVSAPAAAETKQVAIKFVTDDPDIIIYWLVDEKGD